MHSKPVTSSENSVITPGMRVSEILLILPEAEEVFAQYGLHCNGCSIGGVEILEDAAGMHGMKEEDLNDLLTDLHVLLSRKPARPQTITITDAAATALHQIVETEGKVGWVLQVGLDETGGFSLELVKEAGKDDHIFKHHQVTVSASTATLATIGGSTIDHRDGRFKLDLPTSAKATAGRPESSRKKGCACENGGECGCKEGEGCECD